MILLGFYSIMSQLEYTPFKIPSTSYHQLLYNSIFSSKSLLVNVELIKVSASTLLQEELFKILNSTNVITVINLARFG